MDIRAHFISSTQHTQHTQNHPLDKKKSKPKGMHLQPSSQLRRDILVKSR